MGIRNYELHAPHLKYADHADIRPSPGIETALLASQPSDCSAEMQEVMTWAIAHVIDVVSELIHINRLYGNLLVSTDSKSNFIKFSNKAGHVQLSTIRSQALVLRIFGHHLQTSKIYMQARGSSLVFFKFGLQDS